MKILVTGAAGFIGYHLVKSLVEANHEVIGLDNINDYYSTNLKFDRLNELGINMDSAKDFLSLSNSNLFQNFKFTRMNLEDRENLPRLFKDQKFDVVCNLAAQAGVRYVSKNPNSYFENNIKGFYNILDASRLYKVKHLVAASTSSVYGINKKMPYDVNSPADHPTQFYAASKRSNETRKASMYHGKQL